jgi:hypothetical protein
MRQLSMRQEVPLAVCLTVVLAAASPVRAQGVTSRPAIPAESQAPPTSDSLAARMRALGRLSRLSFGMDTVVVNSMHGTPECPMPILRPDSTRQFAAVTGQPLRSGRMPTWTTADRMPTWTSVCTNPLDKGR